MKKYIITLALATALLTGCTSGKVALENLRKEGMQFEYDNSGSEHSVIQRTA